MLIVCLDMKCVFKTVSIYSDVNCTSGWVTYIKEGILCVVRV